MRLIKQLRNCAGAPPRTSPCAIRPQLLRISVERRVIESRSHTMKKLTPFRGITILGLSLLIFISTAVALAQHKASSSTAADWMHFGYDGAFTACNTLESTIAVTNVATLERKWGIGCNDGYFSVISRS